MGYVVFEDIASGKLYEGMVFNPYERVATSKKEAEMIRRQDAIRECTSKSMFAEIRAGQHKCSARQKTLASLLTGFAGIYKICSTFQPEAFMSKGYENVFDYVFSHQGLTSIGLGLGLIGGAYMLSKAASISKARKEYNIQKMEEFEAIGESIRNGGMVEYPRYNINEDTQIGKNVLTVTSIDLMGATAAFMGGATFLNTFHPESYLPQGCENAFEYLFSQGGLKSVGMGLGLMGGAWVFSKISSLAKEECFAAEEGAVESFDGAAAGSEIDFEFEQN